MSSFSIIITFKKEYIFFLPGLLISEMSAMITAHSSSLIEYDYGINELRDGLKYMNLSPHQMGKMWDYVRELWNRQQGKQVKLFFLYKSSTNSRFSFNILVKK